MKKQNRYPGIRPFTQDDDRLFFGRSESIKRINRMFKLERLMVLFGKSGLGKTSLVQAGAIPILHREDMKDGVEDFRFETVRFGAFDPEKEGQESLGLRPVEKLRKAIEMEKGKEYPFPTSSLFDFVKDDGSPWLAAKDKQLSGDHRTIVLIIDQSEELFTWPREDVDAVKYALRDLLNQNLPDHLEDDLRNAASKGSVTYGQLMSPPELKAMLVIRSDRLDELEQMTDVLPNIYSKRFELPPLDRNSAREAVEEPAYLDGEFSTPKFAYSEEGLRMILDFLCNKDQESDSSAARKNKKEQVEGFQLQMICQHVEKVVQRRVANGETDIVMDTDDIGDLQEVTKTYYQDVLAGIEDPNEREKVQILVEEKLIYDAGTASRRLSEFDGVIMDAYAVSGDSLGYLHDSRLLRRMSLSEGGYMYEISHDSLMAPILEVKKVRLEELERIRKKEQEDREKEEQEIRDRVEREQREKKEAEARRKRRAGVLTVIATLGVIAIFGLGVSIVQTRNARLAEDEAKEAVADAESANSELQAVLNDLREEEKLREQLIVELAEAKTAADSAAALAKYQEGIARAEKVRSDAISQKFFNSEMERKYGWFSQLEGLDPQYYYAETYLKWVDNGAEMDSTIILPKRLENTFASSQRAFALRLENLNLAYSLAYEVHKQADSHGKLLTASLAKTLIGADQFEISEFAEPRPIGSGPVSVAVISNPHPSSDRRKLASMIVGYDDGTVKVLNPDMGTSSFLEGPHNRISSVLVSPDEKYLVTGSWDSKVYVYNTSRGALIDTLKEAGDYVRDMVFIDQGRGLLVASDDGYIRSYSLRRTDQSTSFEFEKSLSGHDHYVMCLDVSQDESRMVSGDANGEILIWDKNARGVWNLASRVTTDGTSISDIVITHEKIFALKSDSRVIQIPVTSLGAEPTPTVIASHPNPGPGSYKIVPLGTGNEGSMISFGTSVLYYLNHATGSISHLAATKDGYPIGTFAYDPFERTVFLNSMAGSAFRFSYRSASRPITEENILTGNLPKVELIDGVKYGLYDSEMIQTLPVEEQITLYNEIAYLDYSQLDADEFASINQAHQALIQNLIGEYAILTRSDKGEKLEGVAQEIMQNLLAGVRDDRLYSSEFLFTETSSYKIAAESSESGRVADWLTWAFLWSEESDLTLKRFYARQANQALPGDAWKNIILGSEIAEPDNFVEFNTDFNSVEYSPNENQFFATWDVDQYSVGAGMFRIEEEGNTIESIWEINPSNFSEGAVVWDASFSPDGSQVLVVASSGQIAMYEVLEERGVERFVYEFPTTFFSCAMISTNTAMVGTSDGYLMRISIGETLKVDTVLVHGEVTNSIVHMPVGSAAGGDRRWAASTQDGYIFIGIDTTFFTGGQFKMENMVSVEETKSALTFDPFKKKLYASLGATIYQLDLHQGDSLSSVHEPIILDELSSSIFSLAEVPRSNQLLWGGRDGQIGSVYLGGAKKNPTTISIDEGVVYGLAVDPRKEFIITAGSSNRLSLFEFRKTLRLDGSWLDEKRKLRTGLQELAREDIQEIIPEGLQEEYLNVLSSDDR